MSVELIWVIGHCGTVADFIANDMQVCICRIFNRCQCSSKACLAVPGRNSNMAEHIHQTLLTSISGGFRGRAEGKIATYSNVGYIRQVNCSASAAESLIRPPRGVGKETRRTSPGNSHAEKQIL